MMLWHRRAQQGAWKVVGAAVAIALLCAGWSLYQQRAEARVQETWQLRLAEVADVQQRAQPIIDAIARYRDDHTSPPARLSDLVPRYLPQLPVPGPVARDGAWFYTTPSSPKPCAFCPKGESWVLGIWVRHDFDPRNPWSFGDNLVYLPSGNYPHSGWGGILDRVADWGYYCE